MSTGSRRLFALAAVALLAALVAASALQPQQDLPTLSEMATRVGTDVLRSIGRGYVAGRSGEIALVPKPHRFPIGEWDLRTLSTDEPVLNSTHGSPWRYLARVPLILYGPRLNHRLIDRTVAVTDLAATYARLLGIGVDGLDGVPLAEVREHRPRTIVTVVVDAGGWNVLEAHRDRWPNLSRLRSQGVSYENALLGAAPSTTASVHTTFGTGVWPRSHGIPANQMRGPGGAIIDPFLKRADPRYLRVPTISELWDEHAEQRAVVAAVAYEGWHLGMIGSGAARPDADKDIAAIWDPEDAAFSINRRFYALPEYLVGLSDELELHERGLDARDGNSDEAWFGHPLAELSQKDERQRTPAFVSLTGDAALAVLEREDFGRDEIADLLWVEFKSPDGAGHRWGMEGLEMGDVLAEVDAQIGRLLNWLERNVKSGDYLLAVSADHGFEPLPDDLGGWRINQQELQRDLIIRFGRAIELVTPSDVYVDEELLRARGFVLTDVARWLGAYTIGDNLPLAAPGRQRVPEDRLGETLFAGAFPGSYVTGLNGDQIRGFGHGEYAEGRL